MRIEEHNSTTEGLKLSEWLHLMSFINLLAWKPDGFTNCVLISNICLITVSSRKAAPLTS